MTVERIATVILRCTCDKCGHKWDTAALPKRCAKCTTWLWNSDPKRERIADRSTT